MARSVWTQNKNNIQDLMQEFAPLFDFWTKKGHEIQVADIISLNIQAVEGALGGIEGFIEIKADGDKEIRYSCRDIIQGCPIIDATLNSPEIKEPKIFDVSNEFKSDLFSTMVEKASQLELIGGPKEVRN